MLTTRFAPSPTGRLHLGHAFSALTAWTAAKQSGGRFLLRIEDIDPTRCRPDFEAGIYEDLAWLSLGPTRPPPVGSLRRLRCGTRKAARAWRALSLLPHAH
jgi:glutamyl-Q tRNA(Asp) synthetase